tara:strand:- start:4195 stop:5040 length:846 start_codon:yes stop_codon:yes gene_type:complete
MKIAVLITVHNRIEKTLFCLKCLYKQNSGINFEVYLTDDGSNDGTSEILNNEFPQVKIIQGNGSLFWNRGMISAWRAATNSDDYDFYLWLNNDTFLLENSINELLSSFHQAKLREGNDCIIIGSCKENFDSNHFSYGGRNHLGPVLPGKEIQEIKYMNGNLVLISKNIYKILGTNSHLYKHSFGDYDYGLRANQNNIKCFIARGYLAVCEKNNNQLICFDSEYSILERINNIYQDGGFNLKDYLAYRKKFFKKSYYISFFKLFLKVIFVKSYPRIKKYLKI